MLHAAACFMNVIQNALTVVGSGKQEINDQIIIDRHCGVAGFIVCCLKLL